MSAQEAITKYSRKEGYYFRLVDERENSMQHASRDFVSEQDLFNSPDYESFWESVEGKSDAEVTREAHRQNIFQPDTYWGSVPGRPNESSILRKGLYGTSTWESLLNYFDATPENPVPSQLVENWTGGFANQSGGLQNPEIRIFKGKASPHGLYGLKDTFDAPTTSSTETFFYPEEQVGSFKWTKEGLQGDLKLQSGRRTGEQFAWKYNPNEPLIDFLDRVDENPNLFYRASALYEPTPQVHSFDADQTRAFARWREGVDPK